MRGRAVVVQLLASVVLWLVASLLFWMWTVDRSGAGTGAAYTPGSYEEMIEVPVMEFSLSLGLTILAANLLLAVGRWWWHRRGERRDRLGL